jgi:hypothetical protein
MWFLSCIDVLLRETSEIPTFQVGILGNAADFYEDGPNSSTLDNNMDRRQMMIAFDMRYE